MVSCDLKNSDLILTSSQLREIHLSEKYIIADLLFENCGGTIPLPEYS